MGKLDMIKSKVFSISKGTFKKVKREPAEPEEMFANQASGKSGTGTCVWDAGRTLTTQSTKTTQFKNEQRA